MTIMGIDVASFIYGVIIPTAYHLYSQRKTAKSNIKNVIHTIAEIVTKLEDLKSTDKKRRPLKREEILTTLEFIDMSFLKKKHQKEFISLKITISDVVDNFVLQNTPYENIDCVKTKIKIFVKDCKNS
ncbi:MAG: hypothetical protein LBJ88_05735 [Campylobacteraceae bacterium]|jgi:hypothetical protein|nr:hypothetical protein [Campylobacteraceae bacterium]